MWELARDVGFVSCTAPHAPPHARTLSHLKSSQQEWRGKTVELTTRFSYCPFLFSPFLFSSFLFPHSSFLIPHSSFPARPIDPSVTMISLGIQPTMLPI